MTLSLRSSMQVTLTGLDSRKLRKTMGKHHCFGILGCLEGAGDAKIWSWNGPGRSRGTFWRPARDFQGISPQVGSKMGARWAKLGPSWQQVATKMGQDSAKLAISGSTGEFLGACWEHFGTILAHGLDSRKLSKTKRKTSVFWYFGVLEEVAEALFWRCWLQDGIFRASCEHLWDMLAPRWPTRRARWPT